MPADDPTIDKLSRALRKAQAAGDAEGAAVLEQELFRLAKQRGLSGSIADPISQGALPWTDELVGAAGAIPAAMELGDPDIGKHYRGIRDRVRLQNWAQHQQSPGTSAVAEIAGALAPTGLGARMIGAAGRAAGLGRQQDAVRNALGAGAIGGIYGYGASPESTGTEAQRDIGLGALLGAGGAVAGETLGRGIQALGRMAGRSATPGTSAYQRAVRTLDESGVGPLTTGERSGSSMIRNYEDGLMSQPFAGDPLNRATQQSRERYQQELWRRVGVDGVSPEDSYLTAESLRRASDEIGEQYRKLLADRVVDLGDDQFLDDLIKIADGIDPRAARGEPRRLAMLGSKKNQARRAVEAFFDDLDETKVSGPDYQRIRKELGEDERSSKKRRRIYRALKGALDRALDRALPADAKKGDIDARYRMLQDLEAAFASPRGAEGSEGVISPLQMASISSRGGSGMNRYAPWRDFNRAAATVFGNRVGKSPTAMRLASREPLRWSVDGLLQRPIAASLAQGRGAGIALGQLPGSRALRSARAAAASGTIGGGLLAPPPPQPPEMFGDEPRVIRRRKRNRGTR